MKTTFLSVFLSFSFFVVSWANAADSSRILKPGESVQIGQETISCVQPSSKPAQRKVTCQCWGWDGLRDSWSYYRNITFRADRSTYESIGFKKCRDLILDSEHEASLKECQFTN